MDSTLKCEENTKFLEDNVGENLTNGGFNGKFLFSCLSFYLFMWEAETQKKVKRQIDRNK